jgi:hypothetical protein
VAVLPPDRLRCGASSFVRAALGGPTDDGGGILDGRSERRLQGLRAHAPRDGRLDGAFGEVWGLRGLIGLIVTVVVVYLVLRFLNII